MTIDFPAHHPGLYTPDTTVRIPVLVDGNVVRCDISEEALQDHFGLQGANGNDAVAAFQANRDAIEMRARRALEASRGMPVLLRTEDF